MSPVSLFDLLIILLLVRGPMKIRTLFSMRLFEGSLHVITKDLVLTNDVGWVAPNNDVDKETLQLINFLYNASPYNINITPRSYFRRISQQPTNE